MRCRAGFFAKVWGRARAERENMKFRTSTKCWIAATIFGPLTFVFWNLYMIHDSLAGRREHILSWDYAVLAWLGLAFTVFFTIAGFHKRFERSD
jgi:hypothetical protein